MRTQPGGQLHAAAVVRGTMALSSLSAALSIKVIFRLLSLFVMAEAVSRRRCAIRYRARRNTNPAWQRNVESAWHLRGVCVASPGLAPAGVKSQVKPEFHLVPTG